MTSDRRNQEEPMADKVYFNGKNLKPGQTTTYNREDGGGISVAFGEIIDADLVFNLDELIKAGLATLSGKKKESNKKEEG